MNLPTGSQISPTPITLQASSAGLDNNLVSLPQPLHLISETARAVLPSVWQEPLVEIKILCPPCKLLSFPLS